MCIPTIQGLGSKEQVDYFIPKMKNFEIRVCYCQTELGHGSDVQNLETTATYDKATKEFVINSPTISSTKFWPGEMAYGSNYAIVFAQLWTGDTCRGVHPFMVPIRDMKTHRVLPGIEVGDIGPKLGYNTKDNGFMRFDHVRVPANALLGRLFKIQEDGTYVKRGNPKVLYSGMMAVRQYLLFSSFLQTAKGLTIAVRYSFKRRQFYDDNGVERRLLDYQHQQHKLIGALGCTLAMLFGTRKIEDKYRVHSKLVEKGDFSKLPEIHSLFSGCKSIFTWWTITQLEICRVALGGHGFSQFSGLPNLLTEVIPNATLEGDNTVMLLQTARSLVGDLRHIMSGKEVPESSQYLQDEPRNMELIITSKSEMRKLENLLQLWRGAACQAARSAAQKLMESAKQFGGSFKDAWDQASGVKLFEAAKLHIILFSFTALLDSVQKFQSPVNRQAFERVVIFFGINQMLKNIGAFVEAKIIAGKNISLAREVQEELLEEIRPDLVGWVESFGFEDQSLATALGERDTEPYERLYEDVKKYGQLNKIDREKIAKETLFELRKLTPKL